MWQFEDSEIYSIGMIHPSHSRQSGLSMLSGVSQFSGRFRERVDVLLQAETFALAHNIALNKPEIRILRLVI